MSDAGVLPSTSTADERVTLRVVDHDVTTYAFRAWVETAADGRVVISPIPDDVTVAPEVSFRLDTATARDGVYGGSRVTVDTDDVDVTAAEFYPYDVPRVNTDEYHTLDEYVADAGGDGHE